MIEIFLMAIPGNVIECLRHTRCDQCDGQPADDGYLVALYHCLALDEHMINRMVFLNHLWLRSNFDV